MHPHYSNSRFGNCHPSIPKPSSNQVSQQRQPEESSQSSDSDYYGLSSSEDQEQLAQYPTIQNHQTQLINKPRISKNLQRKKLCGKFAPYSQYFCGSIRNHEQKQYQNYQFLIQPKPNHNPFDSIYQQRNLSVQKQLQFVRGKVKSYVDSELIENLIKEDSLIKGPVMRQGNKSFILTESANLIYADGYELKICPDLPLQQQPTKYFKSSIKIIQKFNQKILQIKKLSSNILNIMVVRTKSYLFLCSYSIDGGRILDQFKFKSSKIGGSNSFFNYELTAIEVSPKTDKNRLSVDVAVYNFEECACLIYTWEIDMKEVDNLVKQKFSGTDKRRISRKKLVMEISNTPHHIISFATVNARQILVAFPHKISIYDKKTFQISEELVNINNPLNQIYGLCMLSTDQYCSTLFLYSDSRCLSIYDLRSQSIIQEFRHQIQECPPSILKFCDRFDKHPLIIAYSCNQLGHIVLLDLEELQQKQQQQKLIEGLQKMNNNHNFLHPQSFRKIPQSHVYKYLFEESSMSFGFINNPMILFSSNLLYQNVNINSVQFCMVGNSLSIIQIDVCGGVSLEYLMRNGLTGKIGRIKWEKNDESDEKRDLELEWMIDRIKGIYLKEDADQDNSETDSELSSNQQRSLQNESEQQISKEVDQYITNKKVPSSNKTHYLTLTNFQLKIDQLCSQQEEYNRESIIEYQEKNKQQLGTYANSYQEMEKQIEFVNGGDRKSMRLMKKQKISDDFFNQLEKQWFGNGQIGL